MFCEIRNYCDEGSRESVRNNTEFGTDRELESGIMASKSFLKERHLNEYAEWKEGPIPHTMAALIKNSLIKRISEWREDLGATSFM